MKSTYAQLLLLLISFVTKAQPTAYPIRHMLTINRPDTANRISQYVTRIFEDNTGNLWLGTNGDGVCRYDGKQLRYFSTKDGLGGTIVRGIAQDKNSNIWLATDGGVTMFDGQRCTNYTIKDGLPGNNVWTVLVDKSGTVWAATLEGMAHGIPSAKGNKHTFSYFHIPPAVKRDYSIGITSPKAILTMMQDQAGNIWFGSNGGGVYKYGPYPDSKQKPTLTNFSEKNGLSNDFVQAIIEDSKGAIWMGTRHGGLCRFNGKTFTNFTEKDGICANNIYNICEDKAGRIWLATNCLGACVYDGKKFTSYREDEGITRNCIQAIYRDRNGTLWFGFSGGLFRFDGQNFVHIAKQGPWH